MFSSFVVLSPGFDFLAWESSDHRSDTRSERSAKHFEPRLFFFKFLPQRHLLARLRFGPRPCSHAATLSIFIHLH